MKIRLLTAAVCALSFVAQPAMSQVVDGRDFSIDGFAACEGEPSTSFYHAGGTTGGEGGAVVLATNFSELQAYLQAEQPYVVLVDRNISTGITAYVDDLSTGKLTDAQDGSEGVPTTYGERILVASNKTLIGVADSEGNAPLFERISFVLQTVNNVIIRNCRFTMNGVPILKSGENSIVAFREGAQVELGDPDCIRIQADKDGVSNPWSGHVWIDHCEFFNGNAANKDRYDGLVDCKNNVQWVTISYNHFHNHDKSCLFGKGNSDSFDRSITMHHNFFEDIDGSRLPLQRYGFLHYCNNYMIGSQDGYNLRKGAIGYIEACYFENSKMPIKIDNTEYKGLNINTAEGYDIIFKGCTNLIAGYANIDGAKVSKTYTPTATTWVPTDLDANYKVNNVDKTADVPELCKKYSGAGKIEIWRTYVTSVPAFSQSELNNAISNPSTGPSYDANGNKLTVKQTSVVAPSAEARPLRTEVYSLAGSRVSRSASGFQITRTTMTDGTVVVRKSVKM